MIVSQSLKLFHILYILFSSLFRHPDVSISDDSHNRHRREAVIEDPHAAGKYLPVHNNFSRPNASRQSTERPFLAMAVYNSRSVVIGNLAHFQEYNIEVRIQDSYKLSVIEPLTSTTSYVKANYIDLNVIITNETSFLIYS